MERLAKRYLIIAFSVSYLCFMLLLGSALNTPERSMSPLQMTLMILGCLGPVVGGGIAGGPRVHFYLPDDPHEWGLVLLLLAMHYGVAAMLGLTAPVEGSQLRLWTIPLSLILGAQVLGWQGVLHPALVQRFAFWRASALLGVVLAAWFLPLLLLPSSPVHLNEGLPFAIWLLGLSLLQSTVYRRTRNLLCAAVFTAIFFALAGLMPVQNFFAWFVVAVADGTLAYLYSRSEF